MAARGRGSRTKPASGRRQSSAPAKPVDPIPMAEVVCPSCSGLFKAPEAAAKGTCPFCRKTLRFAEVQEFVETAPPGAGARNGHAVPVACPACGAEFRVAPDAETASCPACDTALKLQDEPPVPVGRADCPRCGQAFDTPMDRRSGNCPACGALVEFDDRPGPAAARSR